MTDCALFTIFLCVSGGEWKLKYDRAVREVDFTKKKLQQEFDDKLEAEQQNKKHLERKVRYNKSHTVVYFYLFTLRQYN